jgi:hypothetical protein
MTTDLVPYGADDRAVQHLLRTIWWVALRAKINEAFAKAEALVGQWFGEAGPRIRRFHQGLIDAGLIDTATQAGEEGP